MAKQSFLDKLQSAFGVANYELRAVLLILGGIVIGVSIKVIRGETSPEMYSLRVADNLYRSLDSLADAEKTTFVGVDTTGNALPELATGDTLIHSTSPFPAAKQKEVPSGKINLNTATKAELMKLPGVGESTAEKIIEYRTNQRFRSPEDIMNIKGIGQKKYEKIAPFLDAQ